jgi:hypothetical protein
MSTPDIRAIVRCNLGQIISGGWSDDHALGAGIVRCRGEVVLDGIVQTRPGQDVRFSYTAASRTAQFPRQFRVISSFADPYKRTTTVQFGCSLTYYENLKPANERDRYFYSKEDPNNRNRQCRLYNIAQLPISAISIANACLSALSLTGVTTALSNWYSRDRFDLSAGYVSVLNDLLYAEAKVGYMGTSTRMQIVDLNTFAGSAAVASDTNIIDLSAISGGEPSPEAVAVRYTYNRYRAPNTTRNTQAQERWEREETYGAQKRVEIAYANGTRFYRALTRDYTLVETKWDTLNRKLSSKTTVIRHLADVNGSYIQKLLDAKQKYPTINPIIAPVQTIDEEYFEYERPAAELVEVPTETALECLQKKLGTEFYDQERDSQPKKIKRYTYVSDTEIAGRLPIEQYHFIRPGTTAVTVYHPGTTANRLAEYQEITFENYRDVSRLSGVPTLDMTKTNTKTLSALYLVQSGQQLSAAEIQSLAFSGGEDIQKIINRMTLLYDRGLEVQVITSPDFGTQIRPDAAAIADQENRRSVGSTSESTELIFILGRDTSKNVRIFDLPLAPDDRVVYGGGGYPGSWSVTRSDHNRKAQAFGRAQYRLAFGHRNGVAVQMPAASIPPYPLDRIAVRAGGFVGAYRVDGISWTFDSNGIVCNADCLAWGALGTTT